MTADYPSALQGQLQTLYAQAVQNNERPSDAYADIVTGLTRFLRNEHSAGRIAGFGVHCRPDNLQTRVNIWASRSIRWNLDFLPKQ